MLFKFLLLFTILAISSLTGFAQIDNQVPTVRFLSPLGGERFSSGDNLMISWAATDNVGITAQDLALSTDGGVTFPVAIETRLSGALQSFAYKIPDNVQTPDARLRLIVRDAAGNSAQAITPADFAILPAPDRQAPAITIINPQANSVSPAGQPIVVNWRTVDNVGATIQQLDLSSDGGDSFRNIATFDGNASSFRLTARELDRSGARFQVRISAMDAEENRGEQAVSFSVAPVITMANYAKPTLTISGTGFTGANSQAQVRVLLNGAELAASAVKMVDNNTITVKGNKKRLKLNSGNNTLQVFVDNIASNTTGVIF